MIKEHPHYPLLQFLAEGGSVSIFQITDGENLLFYATTNEHDLEDNFYRSEHTFTSFEDAFSYIFFKYSLHYLHLEHIDPEYQSQLPDMLQRIAESKCPTQRNTSEIIKEKQSGLIQKITNYKPSK
jgi:hypothetical protein